MTLRWAGTNLLPCAGPFAKLAHMTKVDAGETPILDRQAPLPPRALPGSGLAGVLTGWLAVIGAAAACFALDRPAVLRRWITGDLREWLIRQSLEIGFVGVSISALAAYWAMIGIHELAHALVGIGAGFRFKSLRVGPLVFHGPFEVSVYR